MKTTSDEVAKKTKESRAAAKKTKEHVGIQSRSARETLKTSQLLENELSRGGEESTVQYSTE